MKASEGICEKYHPKRALTFGGDPLRQSYNLDDVYLVDIRHLRKDRKSMLRFGLIRFANPYCRAGSVGWFEHLSRTAL